MRVDARGVIALLLVGGPLTGCKCDDQRSTRADAGVRPPASAAPLTPDLSRFAAWALGAPGSVAPYRLKGAFALESPNDGTVVYFSQSAATCEAFLARRPSSAVLFLDRATRRGPDRPSAADGEATVLEADAARGVRATWSYRGPSSHVALPHGRDTPLPQLWEGPFTAAACGTIADPHDYLDETAVANDQADLTLTIDGARVDVRAATLTHYYERRPPDSSSPDAVRTELPVQRVLRVSADAIHCLSRSRAKTALFTFVLDGASDRISSMTAYAQGESWTPSETAALELGRAKAGVAGVPFRVDLKGRHGKHRYALEGRGSARRCN